MKYGKPIWMIVLEAARAIEKESFTAKDIIEEVHEKHPEIPATSISAYVIAMAPNHPSYHYYPTHHPYFEFLGYGEYRLMNNDGLPIAEAQTSTQSKLEKTPLAENTKDAFLQKHGHITVSWTKQNSDALIAGRKNYRWKNSSLVESIEKRNQLSRLIVLSRIRNNGGVDRDTLDRVMEWGFPNNPQFAERDQNRCLEITRQAFNLLDEGKTSDAICRLMSFPMIISRASKIIGLFDQNYFAICDSRVGLALATLKDGDDRIIKIPGRRPQPGKIFPSDNCTSEDWGKNYQKFLWVLEVIRNVLNEEGYPFNIADVEMALFMMGK
ncbi:hypothetical protein MUP01_04405 [Candidatus Bathyarchaeota archaeon]|nr:hypothetical protein [Candidatus Bathyarchaeota archaeon]